MQMIDPTSTWDVRPWGTPAFRIANGDGPETVRLFRANHSKSAE